MKRIFRIISLIMCAFLCSIPYFSRNITATAEIVEGKAECVIEADSGRILYEKRGDLRLPMASTTKILTAITVLEMVDNLQARISIPVEAVGVEGSSVYLQVGDVYTVEELLYGLMLRSGNDCAVALALALCGDILNFCTQMNLTAQKAGALNSHFSNPHGLPAENHYTTARDLCYITRYAMQNAKFRDIVATKYYTPRHWANKNKMLTECDGGIGVKTGYTKEAGRCLVSAVKRGNMTVICTVLNCQPMYERSIQLLEDAYATYQRIPIITDRTILTVNTKTGALCGCVQGDYLYPLSEGEKTHLELHTEAIHGYKNQKIVGQFRIYLSKRLLFSGNLYKL